MGQLVIELAGRAQVPGCCHKQRGRERMRERESVRGRKRERKRGRWRQVKHFTWMLLLKHMFYNMIRGQRKRFFMCLLERVAWESHLPPPSSHSLSPSIWLHLWMVMELTVYTANRTISHSSRLDSSRLWHA